MLDRLDAVCASMKKFQGCVPSTRLRSFEDFFEIFWTFSKKHTARPMTILHVDHEMNRFANLFLLSCAV